MASSIAEQLVESSWPSQIPQPLITTPPRWIQLNTPTSMPRTDLDQGKSRLKAGKRLCLGKEKERTLQKRYCYIGALIAIRMCMIFTVNIGSFHVKSTTHKTSILLIFGGCIGACLLNCYTPNNSNLWSILEEFVDFR